MELLRRALKPVYAWAMTSRVTRPVRVLAAAKVRARFAAPYMLHLGCGSVHFDGWINIDFSWLSPAVDLAWDLTTPLPFCRLIYSEHLLEHFRVEDAVRVLRECRRVLHPDGVCRIAVPSLDDIIEAARSPNWIPDAELSPQGRPIKTRAELVNICFYEWGHKWLYDKEELHRRVFEAGFSAATEAAWGTKPDAGAQGP